MCLHREKLLWTTNLTSFLFSYVKENYMVLLIRKGYKPQLGEWAPRLARAPHIIDEFDAYVVHINQI